MRLLIVDDSKTMRSILATYAQNLNCETAEAVDGVDALEKLQADPAFDVVLIDWDMPRMNGLDLLKHLRADPQFDGLKTMMVTAQSSFDGVATALAVGADDYLMKPLDEAMLVDKLRLLGLVA